MATAAWVIRLERLLEGEETLHLPGGWGVWARQGNLVFSPRTHEPHLSDWRRELPLPGAVEIPGNRTLTATLGPPLLAAERRRRSLRVDCGTIPEILTVRYVRDGDRIAPLGMNGKTRLVRDLLREAEIPVEKRAFQTVVEGEGEILWVVGIAQAESTRVTEGATQVLLLDVTQTTN
ncbi:tRNA lysidine(34) synthetase TilS [Armatimonas sp.]|uniref:tRNA lysidine(34) synthetase TilS n=1 Tax=Armatimonas sp. TaxID=1872638 RepID=UPI00375052F5